MNGKSAKGKGNRNRIDDSDEVRRLKTLGLELLFQIPFYVLDLPASDVDGFISITLSRLHNEDGVGTSHIRI